MVEIKRTRAGQGRTIQRIGVVNVQSGADKVQAQKAQDFAAFSDFAYKKTAELQVAAGEKAAKGAVTVDPATGEAKVSKVPQGYGKYGNEAMGDIIQKQYAIAAENDVRNTVKQLAADANNDPEKFKELYSVWKEQRKTVLKDSGGAEYEADFDNMASTYGAGAYTDMRLARQAATQKKAQVQFEENIVSASRQFTSLYQGGATAEADMLFEMSVEKVRSNSLLTVEQASNKIKGLEKARRQAIVSGAVEGMSAREVEALTVEAQQGAWSKETLKNHPDLKKVSSLTPEEWTGVGSKLSTLKGSLVTQEARVEKEYTSYDNYESGTAKPGDTSFGLEKDNIDPNFVSSPPNPEILSKVAQAGAWNTESVARFDAVLSGNIDGPEAMNIVKNWKQLSVKSTMAGEQVSLMGLSQDKYDRLNTLSNALGSLGENPQVLAGAVQRMNLAYDGEDARQIYLKVLGSNLEKPDSTKTYEALKMMTDIGVDGELPPSEARRIDAFTAQYVLANPNASMGDVEDAIQDNIKSRYIKSDYVTGLTRLAPEQVFADVADKMMTADLSAFVNEEFTGEFTSTRGDFIPGGMLAPVVRSPFEKYVYNHVLAKLPLSEQSKFTIGKNGNTTLVPVYSQSDAEYAEWRVVDKQNGNTLIDAQGKPLMVTTDGLKNVRRFAEASQWLDRDAREQEALRKQKEKEERLQFMFNNPMLTSFNPIAYK